MNVYTDNHLTPEPTEEWRPVLRYEGFYEVSSLGNVRSVTRKVLRSDGTIHRYVGRPRVPHFQQHYWRVSLSRSGKGTSWCVHRLVCEAFHGVRPDGAVVRHLNGVETDNRAGNLAWGTPAENSADMVAHGRSHASRTHCKRGHEFTPENTHHAADQQKRTCRACDRIRSRPKYERARSERIKNRKPKPCRVCALPFVGHPQRTICSDECFKASRRVEFKRGAK